MAIIFVTKDKTNWKYLAIVFILGVIVGAGTLWLTSKQGMLSVEFPEIKKPEKTEDKTADWKTYRNEEHGFEIKYPKDYVITTKRGVGYFGHISFRIEFQSPLNPNLLIYLNIRENPESLPIEEYFKRLKEKADRELLEEMGMYEEYFFPFAGYEPKEIFTRNGQTFYKFIMPGVIAEQSTLFSYGRYIFDIGTYLTKSMQENLEIYNQILSTFRFLE